MVCGRQLVYYSTTTNFHYRTTVLEDPQTMHLQVMRKCATDAFVDFVLLVKFAAGVEL